MWSRCGDASNELRFRSRKQNRGQLRIRASPCVLLSDGREGASSGFKPNPSHRSRLALEGDAQESREDAEREERRGRAVDIPECEIVQKSSCQESQSRKLNVDWTLCSLPFPNLGQLFAPNLSAIGSCENLPSFFNVEVFPGIQLFFRNVSAEKGALSLNGSSWCRALDDWIHGGNFLILTFFAHSEEQRDGFPKRSQFFAVRSHRNS
mmetsp:Transcript_34260/g.71968  ORF Transcript_34260/g.71968 Transcript_34260/m.71968 type:complete len:208 (+) Transcript_34260:120-743(+)